MTGGGAENPAPRADKPGGMNGLKAAEVGGGGIWAGNPRGKGNGMVGGAENTDELS